MDITKHRGLVFWHNAALITFGVIAIALTGTIMNSGFSSSDAVKKIVEKSVIKSTTGLRVVGKMLGTTQVVENKITTTTTPLTSSDTPVSLNPKSLKITYKIIKDASYEVSQDNIYLGALFNGSYNSLNEAMQAAKEKGLIEINPLTDKKAPSTTSAFIYWVINQNSDEYLQNNEIANLVIIYSERDKPSVEEYMKIEIFDTQGPIFQLERTIPNITTPIIDLGGKIKAKT